MSKSDEELLNEAETLLKTLNPSEQISEVFLQVFVRLETRNAQLQRERESYRRVAYKIDELEDKLRILAEEVQLQRR